MQLLVVHEVVHSGAKLTVKFVFHAPLLDQLDELAGLSRILTRNDIARGECLVLTQRKIAQVTYWRGDDDK